MVSRTSTSEIIKDLLNSLTIAPGSIAEISKRTDINFHSVKTYLEMLCDSNVLVKEIANNKIIYKLQNNFIADKDTYFGLPFSQEIKEQVYSFYNYITKKWTENTTKPISKTQIQKILYKTNKNFNLQLPFGWFKYGQACAVPYSYNTNYDDFFKETPTEIKKDLDANIINCINENVSKTKNKHYAEENNPVYIAKEQIIKELNSDLKQIKIQLVTKLYKMIVDLEAKKIDRNTVRLLDDYGDLIEDIFTEIKNKDNICNELRESFNEVWNLISLFIYKEDMKKYSLEQNIIENCFAPDIIKTRENVIDICRELKSMLPAKNITKDSTYLKLKKIQENMAQTIKTNENTFS